MKKLFTMLCASVLISAFCVACNRDGESNKMKGLGDELPGIETKHGVMGTVIGSYSNGFGSLIVQVDEEYPIGETIEYYYPSGLNIPSWHLQLPKAGTYLNMIQVQCKLPVGIGNKISFSVREFQAEKDIDLFTVGNGISRWDTAAPDVPIYVITKYKLNN